MKNDEGVRITEAFLQEFTGHAEWRGTVKETLKHFAANVEQLRKIDAEQWEAIAEMRRENRECRERCDKVAFLKADKTALKDLAGEIDDINDNVGAQEKLQIKQQVTLAFYGIIGGGLFSFLIFLGGTLTRMFTRG